MRSDVKAIADAFLLETYGFSEETRRRLIEKASLEIVQNCRLLRSAIASREEILIKKTVHKLKSNLNALGLRGLVKEITTTENSESCNSSEYLRVAIDLCCKITDNS